MYYTIKSKCKIDIVNVKLNSHCKYECLVWLAILTDKPDVVQFPPRTKLSV